MVKVVFNIDVAFDFDARMFLAKSEDIPGLATEAATFDALVQRVIDVVPELLKLNSIETAGKSEIPRYINKLSFAFRPEIGWIDRKADGVRRDIDREGFEKGFVFRPECEAAIEVPGYQDRRQERRHPRRQDAQTKKVNSRLQQNAVGAEPCRPDQAIAKKAFAGGVFHQAPFPAAI